MNNDFVTKLPIRVLENWDKNPRSISSDEFERLKHRIRSMEQMRPLLVTPNLDEEMPGFIVLGGNMRLRALKELVVEDERFNQVWCTIVYFSEESEGVWRATIAGQQSTKTFLSREDAMMEYSLLDNERSGYYDADELANIMPDFNIDWDYNIDLKAPQSLESLVDNIAPEDTNVEMPSEALGLQSNSSSPMGEGAADHSRLGQFAAAPQTVICPECKSLFDPRKHPYFGDEQEATNTDSLP